MTTSLHKIATATASAALLQGGALDNRVLIGQLKSIVGDRYVLTDVGRTQRFRSGFRFGTGPALAVVQPGCLVEQWQVLRVCVAAGKIVIMQAANTGLTGGSTPDGNDYDRDIVILSTLRMDKIFPINKGRQVICLPGATLHQLENVLRPLKRAPHSVIGSSCIGASVVGGLCNNSGGSLIRRGPAYSEMALYATIDAAGQLRLINHLGIELGDSPEAILDRLDRCEFKETDIEYETGRVASDCGYAEHIREIDAPTPARFNADSRRLFEASGCAGKVAVFAVRLDTFEMDELSSVFYIGSNNTAELEHIRRHILVYFKSLPISAEYIHRVAFDIAEKYGKDLFLAIRHLGTARLPALFAIKARFDAFFDRWKFLPFGMSDRVMQALGSLFPAHLPKRMKVFRDQYEHHLLLKMSGPGIPEARAYLASHLPSLHGAFFECTAEEGEKAFMHRFAVAGAAIRYRAIHRKEVEDIVSLDIALNRNDRVWFEQLPRDLVDQISHSLYYGHFFCHVFHQDYIVVKGYDVRALEQRMFELLDARGAEYPAEHNFGHLYEAQPPLVGHFRNLDPSNTFNPGIGRTSKCGHWL